MPAPTPHPSQRNDTESRYFRWLFAVILILVLGPIAIYIYVLEIHSTAIAQLDAAHVGVAARLHHLERCVFEGRCGTPR